MSNKVGLLLIYSMLPLLPPLLRTIHQMAGISVASTFTITRCTPIPRTTVAISTEFTWTPTWSAVK